MNRNQLLTVLKINGLTEKDSAQDIKRVLKGARYKEHEIEAALSILQNPSSFQAPRVDGLHTVFYTDNNLHPGEVSGLLGIDLEIDAPISQRSRKNGFTFHDVLMIVGLSIIFALIGVISYMYLSGVGIFHPLIT